MPFGTITVGASTYDPRTPGTYSKTGVTYDQPSNEFRIRGASFGKVSGSASVQRFMQKDVTVGGALERRSCTVTLQISIPKLGGFSPVELDDLATDIATFISTNTVSRLLQGES